jgi:hypothetical protein
VLRRGGRAGHLRDRATAQSTDIGNPVARKRSQPKVIPCTWLVTVAGGFAEWSVIPWERVPRSGPRARAGPRSARR